MLSMGVRVRVPKITIKNPDRRFWQRTGLEEIRQISKRTIRGKDANEKRFKKYSESYLKIRLEANRTRKVNLTFTGRMLKSMARGVRSRKNSVKLMLTGEEGAKAWYLEDKGREFFSISKKREEAIKKSIIKYMAKKNNMR